MAYVQFFVVEPTPTAHSQDFFFFFHYTVSPPRVRTQRVRNSKGAGSTGVALTIFKGCEKFKACSDETLCALIEQPCCDDIISLPLSPSLSLSLFLSFFFLSFSLSSFFSPFFSLSLFFSLFFSFFFSLHHSSFSPSHLL